MTNQHLVPERVAGPVNYIPRDRAAISESTPAGKAAAVATAPAPTTARERGAAERAALKIERHVQAEAPAPTFRAEAAAAPDEAVGADNADAPRAGAEPAVPTPAPAAPTAVLPPRWQALLDLLPADPGKGLLLREAQQQFNAATGEQASAQAIRAILQKMTARGLIGPSKGFGSGVDNRYWRLQADSTAHSPATAAPDAPAKLDVTDAPVLDAADHAAGDALAAALNAAAEAVVDLPVDEMPHADMPATPDQDRQVWVALQQRRVRHVMFAEALDKIGDILDGWTTKNAVSVLREATDSIIEAMNS